MTRLPTLTRRDWGATLAAMAALGAAPGRLFAQGEPRWWRDGRPAPIAREALHLLEDSPSHGLTPADYGVPALRQALARADTGGGLPSDETERMERALTSAFIQFLLDLHQGRVSPSDLAYRFSPARRSGFDAGALLRQAAAAGDLRRAVREAVPPLTQYERLRQALAVYRGLSGHPAWQQALPRLPARRGERDAPLEPGQPWDGLPQVAARLAALGDLADATKTGTSLDGRLLQALRAFQRRHGLLDDGRLGRATWSALNVTPAQRTRQLALALERLRWTPLWQGPRMLAINLPEFVLRGYEIVDGRIQVRLQMKVIVGRASVTRTPLFDEAMRTVEFQPFWNVPRSIARDEVVPRLRRDPGYWAREGFEFVDGAGRADPALSDAGLQAVLDGRLRIRQRPGPRNALGDIKFVFPNRDAVYLHHTPSTQLFERSRRDFSHGCIRVEQPVALARFVLQDLPGWDEPRIRQAMAQDAPSTVRLLAPLPVLIAYGTALVKDAGVHFFEDIYGHDRRLEEALRRRPHPVIDGLRGPLR